MSDFVPLRVRSHGSLLWGTASPEALVERALTLGYRSLALTDRDNLYLATSFSRHARANGLRPLLGAEVTRGPHRALLLPLDRRGYANLCRVLTRRHLEPDFDLVADLGRHAAGLHVVVESSGLAASLLAAGMRPATGALLTGGPRRTADAPLGGLWLGVRGIRVERRRLAERARASRWLGVPLVATGDCVLLGPDDHETHRVAVTAAAGGLLDRMPAAAFCAPDAVLESPAAWTGRVRTACLAAGVPEVAAAALRNNALLADRCRLEPDPGNPIFPRAPLPDGETGPGYLRRLGRAGVARRYGAGPERRRALARLDWELSLIERLGFTDYFLLVADIVEFARARGIPSVGRGSGASSIVAYCLGITNADPLRHGLHFERFLHPARRDCPDLDIDLCWQRRDEVIAHVYETYGADRVAMISTHATLGARSAFRETAKALGVPNARVNRLARRIPRTLEKPYLDRLLGLSEGRSVEWREPVLRRALRLAERLAGAPRHLSIHCGGVVIGDRPLTEYLPLERAAKGIVVTQFEMRAVEAIGLVKMDLLGNRALTTLGECVALAREQSARDGGPAIDLDLDRLPDPDPETARRLSEGDTLNCFQLESPAMRNLLRMLGARTLEETIAAVALVRPGPAESGMKEAFCRRHRGLEPPQFLDPRLEPVLSGTHGVMLYEEDVMRVAAALAGLSLAEGDALRRAIGGARSDDELAALERGFVTAAARSGLDAATARAVWRELRRFAAYAFCKAHAAGYGALAYQGVYLKSHFPAEYAVGVLNHHAGMYETWVHVEDLRRHGVTFLAPCVQRSSWEATLEPDAGPGAPPGPPGAALAAPPGRPRQGAAVRVGLSRVLGLAGATAERILAARAQRPPRSLADVLDRVRPALPELEALIVAGALDWTGRTRPSLLLEARAAAGALRAGRRSDAPLPALAGPGGSELAPEPVCPLPVPELPEFDLTARLDAELRATGLWFCAHPLAVWPPPRALRGAVPAVSLPRRAGQRVAIVGLPCARRRVRTRSDEEMLFLTLADESGLAECALFPDAYRAHAEALSGRVLRAEGRVDETLGAATLAVERVIAVA